jgi:hypothetical protein
MAKAKTPKKPTNGNVTIQDNTTIPAPSVNVEAENLVPAVAVAETKTPARKITRRPEIVRSEPRANLVPISIEEEIRNLAYLMSERRGFQPGHETEDWLAAEHEVNQRYHQHQHSA